MHEKSAEVCEQIVNSSPHLARTTRAKVSRKVPRRPNKRKSSRGSNVMRESYSERERILSEHRGIHNFLERRGDQAARGERVVQSKLSKARSELDQQRIRYSFILKPYRHGDTRCGRFERKHSIEFSGMASGCKHEHQHGKTRSGNDKQNHWYKVVPETEACEGMEEKTPPKHRDAATNTWRRPTCRSLFAKKKKRDGARKRTHEPPQSVLVQVVKSSCRPATPTPNPGSAPTPTQPTNQPNKASQRVPCVRTHGKVYFFLSSAVRSGHVSENNNIF